MAGLGGNLDRITHQIKEMVESGMDRKEIIREIRETFGKSTATAYRLTEPFFKKSSQ